MNPPEAFLAICSFRNSIDLDELVGPNQALYSVYTSEVSSDVLAFSRPRKSDTEIPITPVAAVDAVRSNLGMHTAPSLKKRLLDDHEVFHEGQGIKHPQCPTCSPVKNEKVVPQPVPTPRRAIKLATEPQSLYLKINGARTYIGCYSCVEEADFARFTAMDLLQNETVVTHKVISGTEGEALEKDRRDEILEEVIFQLGRAGIGR